jgi:bacterial/archaeal transporter family-2 protein
VSVAFGFVVVLVAKQSVRGLADVVREPVWLWTGGALSVLIIVGITVGPPRIGLAATIGTIIALNLGVAALIDRFGWFGYDRIPIGWARILGLVLLGAGAALSLHRTG